MIALLVLSFVASPPIDTPIDALMQQQRCASQIEIQRLVRRCAQIHAPGFPSKRPINRVQPPAPRAPADTYTEDYLNTPIDTQTLAAVLGEPVVVGQEWRYPNAVQAPNGACGIAVGAHSNPISMVRFFKTTRATVRPVRDAHCLEPERAAGLQKLCTHAWFNDVERIQRLAQGTEPPSLSEDDVLRAAGIFASRTQTGVSALFKQTIRPAQLDTIFGPPKPKGTRRSYRHAPPFDQIGRTCTADAIFVRDALYELKVDRGPQYTQPAHPSGALSPSTRSAFEAIEQTCVEGKPLSVKARGWLSTTLGMPAQGYPQGHIGYRSATVSLRYADLLARYGGSIAERQRVYRDHSENRVPRFEGAHQFSVPGTEGQACTLEVGVKGMFEPVSVRRLYFRPPIRPRRPGPNQR
ncbi:MAG: hypothetical protein ACI9U2_003442 [Bradymonadia bacterium]|jgi:hypothetical protein